MTLLTTPNFDFHWVISALTIPAFSPPPTPETDGPRKKLTKAKVFLQSHSNFSLTMDLVVKHGMDWSKLLWISKIPIQSNYLLSSPVQSSPVQSSPVYFSWQSLLSTKDEWDLETKLLCFEEFYTEHGIEGNAFQRQKKFFSWVQYYLVTIQDLKRLLVSAIMVPRSWNWRVFEFGYR